MVDCSQAVAEDMEHYMAFDMDTAEVDNYHRLLVDDVQILHRHCLVEELRDCKAEGQMRNSLYFAIKVKYVLHAILIPQALRMFHCRYSY